MREPVAILTMITRSVLVSSCCGLLLGACGKKEDQAAAPKDSQVVAHVGNEVITTQELDNELRLTNVPSQRQKDPEVIKRVLGELTTRKYLFQQASAAKLDREPNVLLDILRSREQVLANAFVSRSASNKASNLTKADIEKYIPNNPSKFANRELLAVQQITLPIGPDLQAIIDSTKSAKSLDEVDQKLTSRGVAHGRSTGTLNSAQIPDELLKKMQDKGADGVFFVRSGQNGVFLKVNSEQSRPIAGEEAAKLARQLMVADLFKAEIGMASVAAKLEARYDGVYSKIMQDENPSGKD
jgi:EpsD family peptidyl-prolyl cis-trans isomerase